MKEELDRDELESSRRVFKEEARELVSELESALLELESHPDSKELIGRIFRAMHTIKGSGSMFGFDAIARITHEAETVYDLVRSGKIKATKELIDLSLPLLDQILAILEATESGKPLNESRTDEIISSFKRFLSISSQHSSKEGGEDFPPFSARSSETQGKNIVYRIRFRPSRDIFLKGANPLLLLNELRELGGCKVIAHTDCIPELEAIEPEACYTYWDIILTTTRGINAIKDAFIFVEDDCELNIDAISDDESIDEGICKRLGEILIERGDLSEKDLRTVLGKKKLIGEMLVEGGLVSSGKVESALVEQQVVKEVITSRHGTDEAEASIRVPSEKLDRLVNLVGELVTVQARLSQTAVNKDDPELLFISEEVERLIEELRDSTMTIRLLPISTIFSKFRRLVRDLSGELVKEVKLITEGGETELDKTVIERLNDPLVHIIRNGIDHGIELSDIREASGKPRHGAIHLSALHSGHEVLIQIKDDGAGLDTDTIRLKAVEKGIISANDQLSEKEIHSLVLAPGFSTAKDVTDVSGRGVGLDVVKRVIESLRGSLEINSRKNIGTTITLKLPLTLMIIEGLLVKVGGENFVIPLSVVEECIELTRQEIAAAHNKHLVTVRGELVPYIRLRELFFISKNLPAIEQIVICRSNEDRIGFAVDNVIGEHQTVIKPLGRVYRDVKGISGATILGDGSVALILDIQKLIRTAELEKQAYR